MSITYKLYEKHYCEKKNQIGTLFLEFMKVCFSSTILVALVYVKKLQRFLQFKSKIQLSNHNFYLMPLSHWGTVLALLNGMIGGTILVLPILGIQSGWIMIPLVAVIYGLISYFSAYLIVLHLGDAPNINQSILEHFKGDYFYSIIYNAVVGFSLFGFLLSYFPMIIKQLEGLFQPHPIIAPLVAISIFFGTLILKKYHLTQKLLSIGIVGVIIYLFFLVWALATAPEGPRTIAPIDHSWVNLSSAMIMGYAIHDFIIQILIKNPDRQNYPKIVLHTFIIGILIYTFISYGGYAIINRKPKVQNPQTIAQYFDKQSWQVIVLEVMYLINLITMAPQFMNILKVRFMQIFKIQETSVIQWKQIILYAIVVVFMYLSYEANIKITTIIQLNGSIIGFSYIFFIPIWVHLKCVYYDKNCGEIICEQQKQEVKKESPTNIQGQKHKNCQFTQIVFKQGEDSPDCIITNEETNENKKLNKTCKKPSCKIKYTSKLHKMAELILILTILLIGLISMAYTVYLMFFSVPNNQLIDSQVLQLQNPQQVNQLNELILPILSKQDDSF